MFGVVTPQPAAASRLSNGWQASAQRILQAAVAFAFLASIVHYADNYMANNRYPRSSSLPDPSPNTVLVAWTVFTAVGIAGVLLLRARHVPMACLCLTFYSGSGLIGLGHYFAGSASTLAWWRHLHIIVDIASGAAVLGFVLWVCIATRSGHAVGGRPGSTS